MTTHSRLGVSRRDFLKQLGAAAAVAAAPAMLAAKKSERKRPPNFVLIFTDDQGYQDVGCFGSPKIKTPNLDKMAAEGMKFTDFYSAAPVCTPSRAALLTGCYAQRVSLPSVLFPNAKIGLNPKEATIASVLKGRGYATLCVGKWHLGHLEKFLPTSHGFDRYFGIPYSNDMHHNGGVPLLRDTKIIERPVKQNDLTERYTAEVIQFITANKDKPFFVYLPHTFPHVPLYATEKFAGKSARGLYGDVIECIDWSTGEILKTLKTLGLDEDTLVVFTSDNGPWLSKGKNGGCALPLRGGKFTTFEGGMREPCIMRWPGRIPAGKVCGEIASTIDMLPTLAGLAGAKVPADRVIDGKDIYPLMAGEPGAKTPHEAFYYYRGMRLAAVRSGKWKLHLGKTQRPKRKKDQPPPKAVRAGGQLYDLQGDISEKSNVAAENPDVVKRLTAMAEEFSKELAANRREAGKV